MPVTRLRLGIDLDGVIADFNAGWIARYNAEFDADLLPEHVDVWEAPATLTHFTNMREFWRWARTSGGGASIFRVLEPYPDALDALVRLAQHHRVVIVTTKPAFAVHDTFEWIGEHRIPTTEVHIVDDKASVDCDVYLEDADHNLVKLAAVHHDAVVCRFVRPWNRPHAGVVDIESWAEFESLVERLSSGTPLR